MFTEEYCCIIMEGTTQSEYAGYFTVTFYVIVEKDGGNVLLPKNIVKPFWSWNDSLEKEELCRQIDLMKQNGIDGFFMHAMDRRPFSHSCPGLTRKYSLYKAFYAER